MSGYTEDHLVEQPAIQLMQHELVWEEGNIEHRTPNIERRREEMKITRTRPALLRLNPDLPMEAIDGAVEEEVLNLGFWILNGGGRRMEFPSRCRFPDFTTIGDFTFC